MFREALGGDIGFLNLGIISRANKIFGPGPLTLGDVHALFPWNAPPVMIEVSGKAPRSKLERMLTDAIDEVMRGRAMKPGSKGWSGAFPIVAGLEIAWDWERPAGQRLVTLNYNGSPLRDDHFFKVVTSLYNYNSDAELKTARLLAAPKRTEFEILSERISTRYPKTSCVRALNEPKFLGEKN